MKARYMLSIAILVLGLSAAVACREQPSTVTPTAPGATAEATTPAGDGGDSPAYPAPGEEQPPLDAYPAPGDGTQPPTAEPTVPPASGNETPEPADPDDATPVEPDITQTDVTAQPLPDADLFVPPDSGGEFPTGGTVQHTVIRGDWLLQVARCYGTSYTAVRNTNYLPFPDYIVPGQVLTVPDVGSTGPAIGPPCVVEYTVQPGDTWEGLAERTNTPIAVLQRANPGPLIAGQVIFLPRASSTATPAPELTHTLVGNFGGDLAVWRSSDSLVEVTADSPEILDLATNETGRYVLVRQTHDSNVSTEIALIDTAERTMTVVATELPPAAEQWDWTPVGPLHISPDGTWAVFAIETEGSYRLSSFQTAAPGTLYSAQPVTVPEGPVVPAVFINDGSTGTSFIVSDTTGLHEYPYSLDLPPRTIVSIDPETMSPVARFIEVHPVPGGTYLLAQGAFIEGGAMFVIDAATGALGQLPGSESYVISGATFMQPDGTLVVISPTAEGELGPLWTVYRPGTEGSQIALELMASFVTPIRTTPAGQPQLGYVISAPLQQDPAAGYVVAINADPEEHGLWRSGADPAALTRVNDMPEEGGRYVWVPDGSGVLVKSYEAAGTPGADIYVAASAMPPFSLSGWLGGVFRDATWVSP